jgi:adenylyl-sulfate kinase
MTDQAPAVVWQQGHVSPAERAGLFAQGHSPQTIWLTGLSGAGKSTLAFALERHLIERRLPCFVLDGDNLRHGLCKDLGFSAQDRAENIRRVAEVAKLFNLAGIIAITAFISPYRSDRELAKQVIGEDRLVEIYLNTSLADCEQRDTKGLYAKARAGLISDFTGISAPYEPPTSPDLVLDTSKLSVADCLEQICTTALRGQVLA